MPHFISVLLPSCVLCYVSFFVFSMFSFFVRYFEWFFLSSLFCFYDVCGTSRRPQTDVDENNHRISNTPATGRPLRCSQWQLSATIFGEQICVRVSISE